MFTIPKFVSCIFLTLFLTTAYAADYGGVKVDETTNLNGTQLSLNGAGIRYKAIFKVYVAALYVGKKTNAADELLTQPGAKRISITMLRGIDANELGKLFTRGIEDNMPKSDFAKLIPSILRMSQMFSDYKNLKSGDVFTIDWIPNTGTVITIKGKPYGEPFKEPEFFNALLRIWLGPNPADWKLKEALLGKAT